MIDDGWIEERASGNAGVFHQREIPADLAPSVWWLDVDDAALVLGSSQPIEHVDLDACRRAGVEVVRRRSGGGAVLLHPGDAIWVDVLIPTSHHHWTSDVTSSAWWLGDVWRATMTELGVADTAVHHGSMISTRWSGHVCFAGVAGGEVTASNLDADGRAVTSKVVGISQRRTRAAARFQCAVYRRWRPAAHAELFVQPGPSALDLGDAAMAVDATADELRTVFMANLRRSTTPQP